MADIRKMQVGQVVDFVVAFNERQNKANKSDTGKRRATQADINAFFG